MFILSCVQDPVATARGSDTALMDAPADLTKNIFKSYCKSLDGTWRSLVARTLGVREVAGSNPVVPTISIRHSRRSVTVAACCLKNPRTFESRYFNSPNDIANQQEPAFDRAAVSRWFRSTRGRCRD